MKRWIATILLLLVVMAGPVGAQATEFTSLDQLGSARIGVQTGTTEGPVVEKRFPKAQVTYFTATTDMVTALTSRKIDAFPLGFDALRPILAENDQITYLSDPLSSYDCGFAFPMTDKGKDLLAQFDAFLQDMRADGSLQKLEEKWMSGLDHPPLDYSSLPSTNGTLYMATEATYPPFEFVSNGSFAGFDIELATRFCAARGYGLKITDMNFDAVLASTQSGKCDFAGSCMAITEERKESMLFSQPYHTSKTMMVVLGQPEEGSASSLPEISEFSQFKGKKVSMLTGAPFEELVLSKAPDVAEFSSFHNMPDMLLSLKSKKTDAVLINNAIATLAVNRDPALALFPHNLQDSTFGLAFAKGDPRRDTWQATLDAIPKEQIQAAWAKWTGADDSRKVLPQQDWPGKNGTLRAAVCDTLEPMSYAGGDKELMGFDLEIILMIARELDCHVEFSGMEFSAMLASVQSGKADLGAGSIIVTAERSESMDFVNYYPAAIVLIVRSAQAPAEEEKTFWESIAASFEKTFIREDRWQLFLSGVGTTLVITILAILLGTALGFFTFLLCRGGNPLANSITRFALWLVQGMPMVVLLMILYYIIFGKVAISGLVVAVIGFTLTFGASVFGLLKMGVGAIDRGQYEAAYALGYSDWHTFFRIILPQAIPHILPSYKGEIVGLIKATAIVGYIAVQDLTKMGDIVRSRTYEAFFPLIAVTIIYFILEAIINHAVSKISADIDPKRRSRESILEGIKTHDSN